MDVPKTMRIVLLGKTGSGKSSLANTIFGEELLTTNHTSNSETRKCQSETKSVNERKITLIDTPGFFDTDRSDEELKPEIVRCITECAPGPHAFLIVLKVEKITEQEKKAIQKILQYFSEDVLRYATVLFTHGDQLLRGQTIKDFVQENEFMNDLLQKCGGRCHVIDNKYWKNSRDEYRSNQFQVEELLKTIDETVQANNGAHYTNDMLQAVEAAIQVEVENINESSGNMSEEEIRKQARDRTFEKLMIKLAGITTGVLLGALFGVVVMVVALGTGLISSPGSIQLRDAEGRPTAVFAGGTIIGVASGIGAFIGATACTSAVKGGLTGNGAAEGADTILERAKRAVLAVKDKAQPFLDEVQEVTECILEPKSKQSQNPNKK